MNIEIQLDNDTVFLDTDKEYSGADVDNIPEEEKAEEKLVRKALGLPITKQLVYYPNKRDASSVVNVVSYRVNRVYGESDKWYVIVITTETKQEVSIHSSYLGEMQKPSFVYDMEAQSKKIR